MTQTNANKSIVLTPDFRLTTDGDRNFILERRHTVKPPVNPAEGYVYVPRDEWRQAAFYGFTLAGLEAVIQTVAVRSAWGESEEMAGYIYAIMEERRALTELTAGIREIVA
ncbi:hypothetical protein LOZ80_15270 [Paenibacillus sp. HWE-109]|uniref:hypothetical protein n=1 Tax=Paenibacillus sp. HWE-109 TaxID=1306526 RepID=UPI001EE0C0E5|nr:hypothetical protein [Paenibacillus sp. HWE-109]UKS30220.1 hypothetical protein LOZ80_15270 [Paenibacillus sp. HWE-109]